MLSRSVVVADGSPAVRARLRTLLAAADGLELVGEAATGAEVTREVLRHRPDVLVIDLRLGVFTAPDTATLAFTEFAGDLSIVAAIRSGVRGHLLKSASGEQIVRAIRGVAAGAAVFDTAIADRVLALLTDRESLMAHYLTARQREVFDLLTTGLPDTTIARRLGLSPKTVRNHVSAILVKLDVRDRAEAIRAYA
ncbi:LuxR C-terminal-related transcriptional regulator [Amycolatopsis sp. cg5]|uniref:LuxR C-terminal-related transcriptional regulator n=1 Tax=Amycolatopsis sp. cg5 TaxID=3238802 RepID=UPI003523B209